MEGWREKEGWLQVLSWWKIEEILPAKHLLHTLLFFSYLKTNVGEVNQAVYSLQLQLAGGRSGEKYKAQIFNLPPPFKNRWLLK